MNNVWPQIKKKATNQQQQQFQHFKTLRLPVSIKFQFGCICNFLYIKFLYR